MYIVYLSSRYGSNQCRLALNTEEVNAILRSFDFPEVSNDFPTEIESEGYYYDEDEGTNWVTIHKLWARGVFMGMFRELSDDEIGLTADDRHEIFAGIMFGQSDFTAKVLENVLNDYCVTQCAVVDYTLEHEEFMQQIEEIQQTYVQNYDNFHTEL